MIISDNELMEIAKNASKNSYSPYSKFPVGAAILYDDGTIYTGVNVENSSFGLTLCAERNALSTAIAAGQQGQLLAIAIYAEKEKMCAPCGACRQWIWEFAQKQDVKIILEDKNEGLYTTTIKDIFKTQYSGIASLCKLQKFVCTCFFNT